MANLNRSSLRLAPTLVLAPIIAGTLGACSPMSSSFKANDVASTSIKPPPEIPEPLDKLSCLNNVIDYSLNTRVVDFHMTDKIGGKIGAKVGGAPVGIDLGATYETGELHTAMEVRQPLYGDIIAAPIAVGTGKDTQLKFNIDLAASIASLGLTYETATPISKLAQAALDSNLTNLMSNITNPWSTTISQINGADDIEIPVGTAAGLQVGDEFNVYDVDYRWEGEPCESKLRNIRLISPNPVATLVVSQANSPTSTILSVKALYGSTALAKYQQVVLAKQLIKTTPECKKDFWTGKVTCVDKPIPRAPLRRSIKMADVTGEPIYFNLQGQVRAVDITKIMNEYLKIMLTSDKYSFYLKQ